MRSNGSSRHSVKEIEFQAEDLLESLRGHAEHLSGQKKLNLRVTKLLLPPRLMAIRPEEIRSLRHQLKVSQPVFAALLNVPLATARSWEQGRRSPSGAALRLLDLARREPRILAGSLGGKGS